MSLRDWVAETREQFDNHPPRTAISESAYDFYVGALRRVGERYNYGTSIWEHDWDVLVIVDACRADVFEECYGDDERFGEVARATSVASHSVEFMEKTFSEDWTNEQTNTAYVCGNPFSKSNVDPNRFAHLDETWRYGWDADLGTIPAEPISDAAVRLHREHDPDRMIVHYMQPHVPFVVGGGRFSGGIDDAAEWGDWGAGNEFDMLRRGEATRSELWDLYRQNLRYVVEQVADTLLVSIDAERVVFSADHGNAFGERSVYGHPREVPLRVLKEVPWAVTSATDTGEYDPASVEVYEEHDRKEMLESLGYR